MMFLWLDYSESYVLFADLSIVSQKKLNYQTCRISFRPYNTENRSACQRPGFFVPAILVC